MASRPEHGNVIYLGLVDRAAIGLLDRLIQRFLMVWAGTVLLGFVIAYTSARRTLSRVEEITETASRIGTDNDLRKAVAGRPSFRRRFRACPEPSIRCSIGFKHR